MSFTILAGVLSAIAVIRLTVDEHDRTNLMIALMPLKLALFYKNHRKYDIKFIQPPPELALKSVQVYASWNKNSRNISTINEMVSMLQTLSSFRR